MAESSISVETAQKLLESKRLGQLQVKIPATAKISIDLETLLSFATDSSSFGHQTRTTKVEAICLYGSTLYKHFEETRTIEERRRRYILFGPEQVSKKTLVLRRKPKDTDVMVITREGLTEDKVIVPVRRQVPHRYGLFNEYGYIETISDGGSGVTTKDPDVDFYGHIEGYVPGADLDLHITYRSIQQLLSGLGHGDELSESVVRYGVPIFGRDRFESIIEGVQSPTRSALHSIEWSEDSEGKLTANLIGNPKLCKVLD